MDVTYLRKQSLGHKKDSMCIRPRAKKGLMTIWLNLGLLDPIEPFVTLDFRVALVLFIRYFNSFNTVILVFMNFSIMTKLS